MQDGQPLTFISRALTDTETRYNRKRITCCGLECGEIQPVHVWSTGERPVRSQTSGIHMQQRPERYPKKVTEVQRYDVAIRYHQGKKMFLADALSRAFVPASTCDDSTEYCVHSCTDYIHIPGAVLN